MPTLTAYLQKNSTSPELMAVVQTLATAIAQIANSFKNPAAAQNFSVAASVAASKNPSGDQQIALDVLSNDLLTKALQKNPHVALIASEELKEPIAQNSTAKPTFSVTFDPLDGSSVIDANFTVGTIVALYNTHEAKRSTPAPARAEGERASLLGTTGRAQVASLLAVYGPTTCLLLATQNGVSKFQWSEEKKSFLLHKENITLKPSAKYFAPGNLHFPKSPSSAPSPYQKLFTHWLKNDYKLRYSGSMAADVHHMFIKGGGIFAYPASPAHPKGKLRLLYECAPLAFMVEKASGLAVTVPSKNHPEPKNILDIPVTDYHQTSEIFIGSKQEVQEAVKIFQSSTLSTPLLPA